MRLGETRRAVKMRLERSINVKYDADEILDVFIC